jgi:outer membrane protein assembly factor BamB
MRANRLPSAVGPAAAPVIASVTIGGVNTSVAISGGGDARVYALNASAGAIIWIRRLGVSPASFLCAAPAFINDSLYTGVSSYAHCALTQGLVVKVTPVAGAIRATLKSAPNAGVRGVWTNLTYDPSDSGVSFSTRATCAWGAHSVSLVKVRAGDLRILSAW